MAEKVKLTPEQEEAERVLTAAGYVDEVGASSDGSALMPEDTLGAVKPETTGETPAEKPPESLSAEELVTLREQAKRGGWADREKDRADRERAEKDVLAVENTRLRAALGTPVQPPAPRGTPEEEEREKIARDWLRKNLKDVLPEILAEIPAEVLGRHPAFGKRDAAILLTHDTVDQQGFLSQFDPKRQAIIRKRVLPELRQRRQASGWTKGYDELWEEKVAQERESAELYGNTPGAPPTRPATDYSADRPATPPHLAGVHGGQPKPRSESPPLTYDEMKVFGLA